MVEVDRYALANARALADACRADYDRYEFHLVAQRLQMYCSEDLGGFYLDVLKDRLYTTGADEPRAPLGADRALRHPRHAAGADGADPVVHRRGGVADRASRTIRRSSSACGAMRCRRSPDASALLAKWTRILAVRAAVLKELEALRQDGRIGSSLQAEVTISAPDDDYEALASLGDDLRFVMITSAARLERAEKAARSRSR